MSREPQPTRSTSEPAAPARIVLLRQCRFVVIKGETRGVEHVSTADVVRIGKASENDVVLPEETVSRVHCEVVRDARGWLLRDLGSTNGTFLDGAEIREAYIRSGSTITAGSVQIAFQTLDERIVIEPSTQDHFGALVGGSRPMREVIGVLERLAPTEVTLIVEGPAGAGKSLCAQEVHRHSRRAAGPLVRVECGEIPPVELEAELFGRERGSDARARASAFEAAQGGTLCLSEVAELPVDLQARLVRVLERRELRRIGGTRLLHVDVRVIATSTGSLAHEVERGRFREDLLRRLAGASVTLPGLQERREDLPALVRALGERRGLDGAEIDRVLLHLAGHGDVALPGHVQGLDAFVALLARVALPGEAVPPPADFDAHASYRHNKERWNDAFERRYLGWLLQRTGGNISRAAREADMDRKHLHKLLKKHGLAG